MFKKEGNFEKDKIYSTQSFTNFKNSSRTGSLLLVSKKCKTFVLEVYRNKKNKLTTNFLTKKQLAITETISFSKEHIMITKTSQEVLSNSMQDNFLNNIS
ncbi:6168_t:CDS:1 [Cetraspora pellucida]|uniref:6168_t:CDS:1 n=1 Tax=Cetraspora pellucida TaxID=1433469 RepID=A0A9N9IVM6_9GLOM|nr:6168_t:CDS:1 [Cetraspora pellucida]